MTDDTDATAVPELGALTADELVRDGAILLDVREPEEFAAGHAPGARPIPLGQLDARRGELDARTRVVCVCRSGVRSATAAAALVAAGFEAMNLTGGMQAWAKEGLPLVRDDGGVATVA